MLHFSPSNIEANIFKEDRDLEETAPSLVFFTATAMILEFPP